ncbi:carbohydrate-binding protein [Paenibacillus sp. ISL-20]|uniref:carbohydrate-binding protein n=1 Tax=Paenibacillus sp. ISL-20 TaxID=2819163 RepID=UPI0020364184|nr:carbohydrate-binding protein [Paenibacillus sp. ISL-20]
MAGCLQETGWIAFHDVDLGDASVTFEARVSGHIKGGEIAITTGSPDGPAAGSCKILPTGGRQAWTTVQAQLTGLTGRADVFLIIKGEVQISWFRIA